MVKGYGVATYFANGIFCSMEKQMAKFYCLKQSRTDDLYLGAVFRKYQSQIILLHILLFDISIVPKMLLQLVQCLSSMTDSGA